MEITPHPHGPLALPLPIYEAVLLADATDRDGERFGIYAGLTEDMVAAVRTCSLDDADSALQDNTSDRKRFGEGSYEEWYGKNRSIFSLVHEETGALAAIAWFGPKALGQKSMKHLGQGAAGPAPEPGDWHTISFRSYGRFRGKGLMTGFCRFATEEYLRAFPGARLWSIAERQNAASIALTAKLGFESDEGRSDEESVVMIRK